MQVPVPAVIMRGGTSRAIFFREEHLPPPGPRRDAAILAAVGSPDPFGRQIDGVGGSTSVTSKVAVISRPYDPDHDVHYLFAQADIRRPLVDYSGNCGNISSAVGPYAVEEGLVEATDPVTPVRIYQVNTGKTIVARVPTRGGKPVVEGDFFIDGIPFPGPKMAMEFLRPEGSLTSGLLPTGRPVDELVIPGVGPIRVTLVDAANPVVFFRAEAIGLTGTELGDAVDGDEAIRRVIEHIRAQAAVAMGLASSPEEATAARPGTPKVAFVSPPVDYVSEKGTTVRADAVSLVARVMSMGKLHRTYAVTSGIATACAALIPGSVVHEVASIKEGVSEQDVFIGHPSGVLPVGARVERRHGAFVAEKGIVYRHARRLMEGRVYIPVPPGEPAPVAAAVEAPATPAPTRVGQLRFPATWMRGGTSKGLLFREGVLPEDPRLRDPILLRLLGGPDPFRRQVDGLGSAMSSTSKAAIVGPSSRPDADVDFFFAQVGIAEDHVDYSGNCGNLSSAVGPFAIQEGLVKATDPVTSVRVWQVNTEKLLVVHVPTRGGVPLVQGDCPMDGLPRPGAEIVLEFVAPGGSDLFPTGRVVDAVPLDGGGTVRATLVNAGNPAVFVDAASIGLQGTELPPEVDGDGALLKRLETLRARAAVMMGLARTPEEATARRPGTPKIAWVSPPAAYTTSKGERLPADAMDVVVRQMSMGRLHHALTGTGAVAAAVAALVPGTVVHEASAVRELAATLRLGHVAGVLRAKASVRRRADGGWEAEGVSLSRTARRLMDGFVFAPPSYGE